MTRGKYKMGMKYQVKPGMVVHGYKSSTQEAEAGGWRVQGQPRLQSKTLSKNK
jgi:hypothetical protein